MSSTDSSQPLRVVIVPGNGCTQIERANWYVPLAEQLREYGCDVRVRTMPDPNEAKRSIWLPFIADELGADENTVLIGHSSGAVAGLRFLEGHRLRGLILVSACHTDLGMASEAISGYYPAADGSNPWQWDVIKRNAQWIVQYHSTDDPFIPIAEADYVHDKIGSQYVVHSNRGHYIERNMPDIIDVLALKCGIKKQPAAAAASLS